MGEDKFNEQIYKKYTALKKRKLLDDELAREREADVKKFREAMMDWVKELEGKNEELRQKMSDMIDAHESNCENFLKEIHERDKEILRLSLLLAEKTDPNNSTAAESLNRATETLNPSPVPLAKGTSKSHSKEKKGLQFNEEANVPCSSSPVDQRSQEVECSRSHMCANMIHMRQLLESLVSMKISLNKEAEGFSFSAWHENTGYSFTLKWLEQRKEWSYTVSSLGSLEGVAPGWMKEEIRFSIDMCRMFFQRISDTIKKS